MRNTNILFPVLVMVIAIVLMGASSWSQPDTIASLQQVTPTSTSAMPPPSPGEWIILNLSPGATQLQVGAEIYRLVCKACHGDKGQGLTDEWRSTWAPADQNCWKSKCHASNHPPDGFTMPVAPGVVGPSVMARFYTASDLHDFISTYMPWQNPGKLTEDQSWQVTAYILHMNNIDPDFDLNAETASRIKLGREPAPTPKPDVSKPLPVSTLGMPILVLLVGALLYYLKRSRKSNF
jgi:cytochrome c5